MLPVIASALIATATEAAPVAMSAVEAKSMTAGIQTITEIAESSEAIVSEKGLLAQVDTVRYSSIESVVARNEAQIPTFRNQALAGEVHPETGVPFESEMVKLSDSRIVEGTFSEFKGEASFVPVNNGVWEAGKGDSNWIPENDYIPLKHNPEQEAWGQIKDEHGFESIPFEKGEPDFTEVSKATVDIEDFSTDRNSNFTQADEKCAEQWTLKNKDEQSWSPAEVKSYRKENDLSWHERGDQRSMDLVPSIVHGNVTHTGGISAAKSGEKNG
jgi:hypothetical protein